MILDSASKRQQLNEALLIVLGSWHTLTGSWVPQCLNKTKKKRKCNKLAIKNVPLLADGDKEVSGQISWNSSLINEMLKL